MGARIMWDVVEEHLHEAGLAWFRWSRATVAPNYSLAEVARGPEEMLFAHLEGLSSAGDEVIERLLIPALDGDDSDEAAAAGLALLSAERGFKVVVPRIVGSSGLRRALEVSPAPSIDERLEKLLDRAEIELAAAIVNALASRGRAPAKLKQLATNADPRMQSAAVRAMRHAGPSWRPFIEAALDSPMLETRAAAVEVGVSLGLSSAKRAARGLAASPQTTSALVLSVLAMEGDLKPIESSLALPEWRGAAIWALGFSGAPRAVDLCMACLEDEKHARIAGEAIVAITGLEITEELMRGEPAREEPVPFEEEDLDADLVPGPEQALPLLDPQMIARWWARERARFQPAVRYLGGVPIDEGVLLDALVRGPMRRRPLLALELAARSEGERSLDTNALARRQLAALEALCSS